MAFLTGSKQVDDQDKTAKNLFMTTLMQNNILITGAYGQLGSELKEVSKGNDNFIFYFTDADTLDITDIDAIDTFVREHHIKYIINCAAYTAVDKAEDDSELCYHINRDAVFNLAKAATKHNAKVIHVSTDYVFDGNGSTPYLETDKTNPESVYGKSKFEGEELLRQLCPDSIIIRTSWLYSVYGNNFVKTMLKLGQERDELNVVADQQGSPTNAEDLAAAIMYIVTNAEAETFKAGTYHFSNEGSTTWYDLTCAIHKIANIQCKVNPITTDQYPTKAKRPKYSVLSKEKIKTTFPKLEIPQWEDSLQKCLYKILG